MKKTGAGLFSANKKMDLNGSSCVFNAFETGVKEDWREKVNLPRMP